ncbi:MAG: hypothetical protein P4L45_10990, partial [Ignavibacteriaceae bacterium]|nr:hypothetical protein [Ignavibacteriaceae bacterium]
MSKIAKLNFLLLGIIILIILILGGITYYNSEKNLVITQKYNELKFIANEKANRILQWRDERIDNTKNISYSPFFAEAVAKWIANKNDLTLGEKIVKR